MVGIEAALHEGEPEDVLREVVLAQDAADGAAVAAALLHPAGDHGAAARVVLVELEVAHDPRVPPHREVGHGELAQPGEVARGLGRAGRRASGGDGGMPEATTSGSPRSMSGRALGHPRRPAEGEAAGKRARSSSRMARSSGDSRTTRPEVAGDDAARGLVRLAGLAGLAGGMCLPPFLPGLPGGG